MPTLNWIGKDAVIRHHKEVPFRLLEVEPELSCGPPDSGNLIVQGDNLHALKALLPRYAGQVKVVYIDPPYNTGQDDRGEDGQRTGWVYNDRVASPEIKAWLGKVVGAEAEDLCRHDKWLCMMYPRLRLLKDFLRDDVLNGIVQDCGNAFISGAHPQHDPQGVKDVRLSRLIELTGMGFGCDFDGAFKSRHEQDASWSEEGRFQHEDRRQLGCHLKEALQSGPP